MVYFCIFAWAAIKLTPKFHSKYISTTYIRSRLLLKIFSLQPTPQNPQIVINCLIFVSSTRHIQFSSHSIFLNFFHSHLLSTPQGVFHMPRFKKCHYQQHQFLKMFIFLDQQPSLSHTHTLFFSLYMGD